MDVDCFRVDFPVVLYLLTQLIEEKHIQSR